MLGANFRGTSWHDTPVRPLGVTQFPGQKLSDLGFRVERTTGIEPASSAWKAEVLPLNYIRKSQQSTGVGSYPSAK